MPWIEAILRGQKVFARADEKGGLVAEGGRVEIRYKPTDARAYRASKGNLEVVGVKLLPDDHCASDAERAPSAYEQKKERKAAAASRVQPHRDGVTVIYTDGACSGNPGPAGCGYVVVDPVSGDRREGYQYLGTATNNIAELTAILRGLEAVSDPEAHVEIRTDSGYSIGVLQKGWKAKANPELIATIKAELKKRPNVRLVYVPGHAGVALNERADELAREAISTRSSRPIV